MAGRTNIAMACKIADCKPQDFFRVLCPLGFEEKKTIEKIPVMITTDDVLPEWIANASNIIEMDVRPILASGKDPLQLIQQQVQLLQQDEVLQIINAFEPTPLVVLLSKKGYKSYVKKVDSFLVETYFRKENKSPANSHTPDEKKTYDWNQVLQKFDSNLVYIDVRHLNMPVPMTTILETLESLPAGKALYVHHKRVPVYLLSELQDLQFEYCIKEVGENEVLLLIFKPWI